MCPDNLTNPPLAMTINALRCGSVRPKLCLGVLSSSRFVYLVDGCLIVRSSLVCRSRNIGVRVFFGVAIDSQVALKGLSSCLVWNASVHPITTSSPSAIAVVQPPGITRTVSPSDGRPFVQSHGDSCQEQPLTPASIQTLFLCPANGQPSPRACSRRNERFPRRP